MASAKHRNRRPQSPGTGVRNQSEQASAFHRNPRPESTGIRNYTGTSLIHVDRRRRGNIPRNTWRRMKHRAAIEPTLGHLKDSKRLDRNRLKGVLGDKINVILSAAGMNFHKIMKALAQGKGFLRKIIGWLLGIRINRPAAMRF